MAVSRSLSIKALLKSTGKLTVLKWLTQRLWIHWIWCRMLYFFMPCPALTICANVTLLYFPLQLSFTWSLNPLGRRLSSMPTLPFTQSSPCHPATFPSYFLLPLLSHLRPRPAAPPKRTQAKDLEQHILRANQEPWSHSGKSNTTHESTWALSKKSKGRKAVDN